MNDTTALLPDIRLRFNIDHPSIEECYVYGYECATAEIDEESNPFAEGTEEYNQWSDGWWAGFYGEEPLFTLNEESSHEQQPAIIEMEAANDKFYNVSVYSFLATFWKITGALAATAVVGYQVLDLVA